MDKDQVAIYHKDDMIGIGPIITSVTIKDHLAMDNNNERINKIIIICHQVINEISNIITNNIPKNKFILSVDIYKAEETPDDTISIGGEIKQLDSISIGYILDILNQTTSVIRKQCFTNNDDKHFDIDINIHVEDVEKNRRCKL